MAIALGGNRLPATAMGRAARKVPHKAACEIRTSYPPRAISYPRAAGSRMQGVDRNVTDGRMVKRLFGYVAVCGWLIASGTLQAHHALENVYLKKEEAVAGTLVRILLTNPHGSLTVSVRNPDGTTMNWTFTTPSARVLAARRIGTNSNVLQPGDQITAKFLPARNGSPIGYLQSITTRDGTTIDTSDGWSRRLLADP